MLQKSWSFSTSRHGFLEGGSMNPLSAQARLSRCHSSCIAALFLYKTVVGPRSMLHCGVTPSFISHLSYIQLPLPPTHGCTRPCFIHSRPTGKIWWLTILNCILHIVQQNQNNQLILLLVIYRTLLPRLEGKQFTTCLWFASLSAELVHVVPFVWYIYFGRYWSNMHIDTDSIYIDLS